MKLILIFFAALSFSSCGIIQTFRIRDAMEAETMKQHSFKRELPFQNVNGFIVVEMTIDGKIGHFILDTGAPTILDENFAKSIAFKTIGKQKIIDSGGKIRNVKTIKLANVSVGGIDFQGIVAGISDFSALKLGLCTDISGFLGANIMNKGVWQIDYANKKITITDSRDSLQFSTDKKVVSFFSTGKGTPIIRMTVNGVYLGEADFDTGNSGNIQFTKQAAANLPPMKGFIKGYGLAAGAFGMRKDTILKILLPTLTLGDSFEIKNTPINLSRSLVGTPLIGYEFLKNYTVTIDWKYQEITFSNYKPSVENYCVYGFSPRLMEGKLIVASIVEQSAAFKAGLELNDQIMQINEMDFKNVTQSQYCDLMQKDLFTTTSTMVVTVKKGEKEVKYELTKTDLRGLIIKDEK